MARVFNPTALIAVRARARFTLQKLGGIDGATVQQLNRYEKGRTKPRDTMVVLRIQKMNLKQSIILVVGVSTLILMGVHPPWTYTFTSNQMQSEKPAGYEFIFSPPRTERSKRSYGVKIDVSRLAVQWFVVALATGLGGFLARTKIEGAKPGRGQSTDIEPLSVQSNKYKKAALKLLWIILLMVAWSVAIVLLNKSGYGGAFQQVLLSAPFLYGTLAVIKLE